MDNSITIFVALTITFFVAYGCGYLYGLKSGIDKTIVCSLDNLRAAAHSLGLDEEFDKIINEGTRILQKLNEHD